ncbi:hypothetical protein ACFL5E_00800 [Candidatus Omnitrophota bacterium]
MKKAVVLAIVLVFSFSMMAVAADAPKGKGKPLSKPADEGSFQVAADHIAQWGKSREIVQGQGLRMDKEEVKKRRRGRNLIDL